MRRILIIDPDVDTLTCVQLVLEGNGFMVIAISRWQQIFEKIRQFKPDLLLLEVSLGNQDGRNICKQIKSDNNTKHISVILFSANQNVEKSVDECLADCFIGKPFTMDGLVGCINNQIKGWN